MEFVWGLTHTMDQKSGFVFYCCRDFNIGLSTKFSIRYESAILNRWSALNRAPSDSYNHFDFFMKIVHTVLKEV